MSHQDKLHAGARAAAVSASSSRDSGGRSVAGIASSVSDSVSGSGINSVSGSGVEFVSGSGAGFESVSVSASVSDECESSESVFRERAVGRGMDVLGYRVFSDRNGKTIDATVRICAGMLSTDIVDRIPKTYRQASASFDKKHWNEAMAAELLGIFQSLSAQCSAGAADSLV